MAALIVGSGFFSCSEAALFYLGREDRERMARGGRGERAAAALINEPDRLLTSILFWNLVINMAYYALSSLVTLKLERAGYPEHATAMAIGALLAIIVFAEMLPKNLGVLWSQRLSAMLGLPLAIVTRVLDPLLPTLQKVADACGRIVAPRFENEAYMELGDLERAITLSGSDPELVEQEQTVLSRVVALSEQPVEELMRPRRHYLAFTPPVTTDDLHGQTTPSGYLLITEPDSEEIASAISVEKATLLPAGARLEHHAQPVALAPWCATAAATLDQLRRSGRRVASVINELGETIGIVTVDDLLGDVLQTEVASQQPRDRRARLINISEGVWHATGRTTLRRVSRQLGLQLPEVRSITVAGLLQEELQDMPKVDDTLEWGGLHWRVLNLTDRQHIDIEIRKL